MNAGLEYFTVDTELILNLKTNIKQRKKIALMSDSITNPKLMIVGIFFVFCFVVFSDKVMNSISECQEEAASQSNQEKVGQRKLEAASRNDQ